MKRIKVDRWGSLQISQEMQDALESSGLFLCWGGRYVIYDGKGGPGTDLFESPHLGECMQFLRMRSADQEQQS